VASTGYELLGRAAWEQQNTACRCRAGRAEPRLTGSTAPQNDESAADPGRSSQTVTFR
jgi:hypothetical protein